MIKLIFIVPYRNRSQHKFFFVKHMMFLTEDFPKDSFRILFLHQCDNRNFNRGAMKNIGFLVSKRLYPDTYKDITFVFHDIDTLPFHKLFQYETTNSIVKHFYGYETALGGIFSIKGGDFEKTNGFPNYWGWGMEDACIQQRCLSKNLKIDRSCFYPIGSPNILQFFDGVNRLISKRDYQRAKVDNTKDGVNTIFRLNYTVCNDGESLNPEDNQYVVSNSNNSVSIVNVTKFFTLYAGDKEQYFIYDLRDPVSSLSMAPALPTAVPFNDKEWTNLKRHHMTDKLLQPRQPRR